MGTNKQRHNIVILRSDEHNPRISSLEGHPFVQTPHMERLARMGTVYESHYCPSPLCMPSRSSFLAGRWVHDIQTYNNCGIFAVDTPSYGQVLDGQGVHTVFFGKVDGYCPVADMGFSEMHGKGFREPGDINFGRKPITIRPIISKTGKERQDGWGPENPPKRSRGDNRTVEAAVQWLQTTATTMDQPWSMEINISNPHFPQYVSQELWDLYAGHDDLPEHGGDVASAQHPYAQDLRQHFQTDKFREESVRGLRRGYYGCVTFMDQKIGQMLDVLESTGLIDNTIFVYTSDHGEMLGKFGMWWKCSLYDDSVRAPLIVAGPGFEKGVVSKTAVSQLDLQASIFEAVGGNRPDSWAGSPLQKLGIDDDDRVAFSEYHGHGVRGSGFVIRKGKWKYIHNCEAQHQLFDIASDRDELHNLFDAETAVASDMESELRKICDPDKENTRADTFTEKQLKAIEDANLEYLPGGHATYRNESE